MTEYRMPIPPSANNAYKNVNGYRARTKEHNEWIKNADDELRLQRPKPFVGRAIVYIDVGEQDAHASSDVANREKLVTDRLVHWGILKGDSMKYVKGVFIQWDEEVRGVRVRLEAV